MNLTYEDELRRYLAIKQTMDEIPNDYRSQNFTRFYSEIEARIYETTELIEFLNK